MPKKASETKKEVRPVDFNGVIITGRVSKVVYESEKLSMFTIASKVTDNFTSYITCKMFANDVEDFDDLLPVEGDDLGLTGVLMTEKYQDKKTKKDVFNTYIKVREINYDIKEFKDKYKK